MSGVMEAGMEEQGGSALRRGEAKISAPPPRDGASEGRGGHSTVLPRHEKYEGNCAVLRSSRCR